MSNQKNLVKLLDEKLTKSCKHVERLGSDEEISLWLFDNHDAASGMVAVEKNSDLPGFPPTVSVAIAFAVNVKLTNDELLKLLSLNGLLYNATITAEEIGGEWTFYLQRKVSADNFKVDDFEKIISELKAQQAIIEE